MCVTLLEGPDGIFPEKEGYGLSCREGVIMKEIVYLIDLHSWKMGSPTMATSVLKTGNSAVS